MLKKILLGLLAAVGLFAVVVTAVALTLGDEPLLPRESIGVIEVKGMILDSSETIRQLERFVENDSVKGIVLRVDSPGGVVAPSQEIHEEVRKVVAARKKPVVVSMGSVAASGGYYISAPATM
ncbi:MAG TPA: S49 family peptidase, partial [Verrucomicrobiae bacterium]|nr:S49 family peptidase [Verrucomicrobiae bacterium]